MTGLVRVRAATLRSCFSLCSWSFHALHGPLLEAKASRCHQITKFFSSCNITRAHPAKAGGLRRCFQPVLATGLLQKANRHFFSLGGQPSITLIDPAFIVLVLRLLVLISLFRLLNRGHQPCCTLKCMTGLAACSLEGHVRQAKRHCALTWPARQRRVFSEK